MLARIIQFFKRTRAIRPFWLKRRRKIRAAAKHLKPGLYLACDEQFFVWRLWTARLPGHLVEARIRNGIDGNGGISETVRLCRLWVKHTFAIGAGLLMVRSGGGFSVAVVSRDGTLILLDAESGSVKRLAERPIYTTEYIALRSALASHIPCPVFAVDEDGAAIAEEFVQGEIYETLGKSDKRAATRVLLQGFAELVANQGVWHSEEMLTRMRAAFAARELPETLRIESWFARTLKRSRHWPLVPAHGDLHSENIVVRQGDTVLIDLAGIDKPLGLCLSMRPFWYDAITLIVSPAVPDLFQEFLEGHFDDEFTNLYARAGCDFDPGEVIDTLRTWVLLRAFEKREQLGFEAEDRLVHIALQLWDDIYARLLRSGGPGLVRSITHGKDKPSLAYFKVAEAGPQCVKQRKSASSGPVRG